jgi:histidine triad (HIT) family protein
MAGADRCLFCRIIAGEIPARKVYEDAEVFAFEDINPQAPTHVLIVPKRHIGSLDDLTEGDHEIVGTVIHRASELARQWHLNEGYRLVVNCGEAAGQTVFHVHVHMLGGRNFTWPPG